MIHLQYSGGYSDFPEGIADSPVMILQQSSWNDYNHRTMFNIFLKVGSKRYKLGELRLLFRSDAYNYKDKMENTAYASSGKKFAEALPALQPPHDSYLYHDKYVSVPTSKDLYENLFNALGNHYTEQEALAYLCEFIALVHDAGFVQNKKKEYDVEDIITSSTFNTSLVRESQAIQAYNEAWRVYYKEIGELDYSFVLSSSIAGSSISIPFNFKDSLLPSNINLLVGPNGVGKTKTIEMLLAKFQEPRVNDFSKANSSKEDNLPAFRNLLFFSYSPFEEYRYFTSKKHDVFQHSYHFFGVKEERGTIDISLPERNSNGSLVNALKLDSKLSDIKDEGRFKFLIDVLKNDAGISFDEIRFPMKEQFDSSSYPTVHCETVNGITYVAVRDVLVNLLLDVVQQKFPVLLYRNNRPVRLSSGQKMFFYITCCLVGNMGKQTLVIMDEPECYLHPTLEITLLRILKRFLERFESYAIIATHSMSLVREVASKQVHVLSKDGEEVYVQQPALETFGTGLEAICSTIFDDYNGLSPAIQWAAEYFKDKKIEELPDDTRSKLSFELLSYLNWEK